MDEGNRDTGEVPPERPIYFIFTDPVLGAKEGVTVLSNSDLKQDARRCVRSVKIQKLYQSFFCWKLLAQQKKVVIKAVWLVINGTDRVAMTC